MFLHISVTGKVLFLCALFFLLSLFSGCAVFSTPQERSGVNPKPFNYQTNWEIQPNQGRIFN